MMEQLRHRVGCMCDAHPVAAALVGFALVFALVWFGGRFEVMG